MGVLGDRWEDDDNLFCRPMVTRGNGGIKI